MKITYTDTLSVEQYNALRKSVGWSEIHPEKAKLGLEHTAFLTVAEHDGTPVGMARVISDYGYVAYIADVVVNSNYQGNGIGRQLMSNVMAYIESTLIDGHSVMVILVAAKGKEEFYQKFGFLERPNDEMGSGMTQWVKQ